jgi:hypothetical protein
MMAKPVILQSACRKNAAADRSIRCARAPWKGLPQTCKSPSAFGRRETFMDAWLASSFRKKEAAAVRHERHTANLSVFPMPACSVVLLRFIFF